MPTVKGVRQLTSQSGPVSLSGKKVVKRYLLEYVVLADNLSQGPITIRETTGMPIVGLSTYAFEGESDTTAILKVKDPRRDTKNGLVWYVRCEFDNESDSSAPQNETTQNLDPTLRPAISRWTSEYGEEVLYQDFSNPRKDILNPVGLPYDPPVTRRVIYPVLLIQRFENTFTPALKLNYEDHVSTSAFKGFPAGAALMAGIEAAEVIEGNKRVWDLEYRIRFTTNPDGFKVRPLNQSTHYSTVSPWAGNPADLEPFIKDEVPFIGNLKADGTKAADDERTYGDFEGYPQANFADLNL